MSPCQNWFHTRLPTGLPSFISFILGSLINHPTFCNLSLGPLLEHRWRLCPSSALLDLRSGGAWTLSLCLNVSVELFTHLQAQGGLFTWSSDLSRAGYKPQGPLKGFPGHPDKGTIRELWRIMVAQARLQLPTTSFLTCYQASPLVYVSRFSSWRCPSGAKAFAAELYLSCVYMQGRFWGTFLAHISELPLRARCVETDRLHNVCGLPDTL